VIGRRATRRLAPQSFVFGLFEVIRAGTTSSTPRSLPGASPTPSPARRAWSTPSTTATASPATTTAPRLAFSAEAFRRRADIREASQNRRALKDAWHHRLVPSMRASGCERVRELVDAPSHGSTDLHLHFWGHAAGARDASSPEPRSWLRTGRRPYTAALPVRGLAGAHAQRRHSPKLPEHHHVAAFVVTVAACIAPRCARPLRPDHASGSLLWSVGWRTPLVSVRDEDSCANRAPSKAMQSTQRCGVFQVARRSAGRARGTLRTARLRAAAGPVGAGHRRARAAPPERGRAAVRSAAAPPSPAAP